MDDFLRQMYEAIRDASEPPRIGSKPPVFSTGEDDECRCEDCRG